MPNPTRVTAHADVYWHAGTDGEVKPISEMEQRDLMLQGWDIDPADIEICKHEDGSDFLLGAGSYGKVRCPEVPSIPHR